MNELTRIPPQLEPVARPRRRPRARSGIYGVLDIGSTKTACMIARVDPDGLPRVLGHGWKRAGGMKGGNVVDLAEAERAVRDAVAAAEEMADHKLPGVICNLSCGQPESRVQNLHWTIGGRAVTEADLRALLYDGRRRAAEEGRESVHAIPLGFTIDATPGVDDPRKMICDTLGAKLHLVSASSASLRNLGATLAALDLEIEELVSAPFAAALAVLVEDEKELGATVVDMGGGCTSLSVIQDHHLLYTAQVPVGGWQVTNDLARGLATPIAQAERIKALYGGVVATAEDEKEMLVIPQVGEDEDHIARVPRAMVMNIVRPRLEETLELVRDRIEAAGLGPEVGSRVVLTGGASQIVGVRELAARILDRQVRLAKPHPVRGLPENMQTPDFATTLGLLSWGAGEGRPTLDLDMGGIAPRGKFARFVNWLRDRV